jgi:hypothetical protein
MRLGNDTRLELSAWSTRACHVTHIVGLEVDLTRRRAAERQTQRVLNLVDVRDACGPRGRKGDYVLEWYWTLSP